MKNETIIPVQIKFELHFLDNEPITKETVEMIVSKFLPSKSCYVQYNNESETRIVTIEKTTLQEIDFSCLEDENLTFFELSSEESTDNIKELFAQEIAKHIKWLNKEMQGH